MNRGLVAAGLLVGSIVGTTGAAHGVRPAQPVADPGPRLELIAQDLAVEPDGEFRLEYRLTGITAEELELVPPVVEPSPPPTLPDGSVDPAFVAPPPPPPPLPLTVEIANYAPLEDPADVDALVGSDVDPASFEDVVDGIAITDVRERATVGADGSIVLALDIGTDVVDSVEQRLKLERPGIHPLRVQLLVGDPADDIVVATAGTVVQRLEGPADTVPPPIELAVMTVVPAPGPDANAADVAASQRALDAAVDLAAALEAPTTLEVPPTLVAENASTPAGAERLATALRDDELVALPLLPLDVSSAVAAGRAEAFTRLVRTGEDVLTAAVPTTPSVRTVWITTDPLSAPGAQHLRDLGVRFVVMPGDLYLSTVGPPRPATDLFVDAGLPDGGALPMLVVDPLAAELTAQAADEILAESTPIEWSVATVGRLLLERQLDDESRQGPPAQRSRVLTTPDLGAPDVRLLTALEATVATTPALRFARGSSLIGVTDTQRVDGAAQVTLPADAGPPLAERVALLDAVALDLASAASMLPADDPRPAEWTGRLDTLVSTGYTDAEVRATTDELLAEADAIRSAVQLPEPFTFTLTGRRGTIEVRLGNTATEPLAVDVQFDSPKILFPEGRRQVTLRPGDQTAIVVPVEALSNGTSEIAVTVTTPAGEALGDPVTLTSRVTGFSGLAQVLTGGLVLVLLTWWFTHWRAKRRSAVIDVGRERHPSSRKVGSPTL
jgi:hypothetical protein